MTPLKVTRCIHLLKHIEMPAFRSIEVEEDYRIYLCAICYKVLRRDVFFEQKMAFAAPNADVLK